MANVTFGQPTDMSNLPSNFDSNYDLYKATDYYVESDRTRPPFFFSCLGTFAYANGTDLVTTASVVSAELDDSDGDMTGNISITNITLGSTPAIVDALNSGNMAALAVALLAGDDHITGSSGDDYIQSWAGADVVAGGAGNDTIDGYTGNDRLMGGLGNDLLGGSIGSDLLIGGPGADHLCPTFFPGTVSDDRARDIIRYTSLADSGTTPATRDEIFGFIKGSGPTADRIDLSPIDADPSVPGNQAFHLVSSFTAAHGEVRLVPSGGNTLIQVDVDSDPAPEMTILVLGVVGMHSFDFVL